MDVYPTQARIYLSCDDNNEKLLNGFDAVLIDDQCREYKKKSEGITALGYSEGIEAYYYESSYFVKTKSLKIAIRNVNLLDKNKQRGDISYENRTIGNMPEGISIEKMKLNDDGGLILELNVNKNYKGYWDGVYQSVCSVYNKETDEEEGENGFTAWGDYENDRIATDYFLIDNFEENKYEMKWFVGDWIKLDTPVEISVK